MMSLENSDCADAPSGALIELIHEQRGHLSPRQRLRGLQSLTLGGTRRREPGRGAARWALASAVAVVSAALVAAVVAVVAAVLVARRGPRSLSYAIDDGRLDPKGLIEADGGGRARLRFSDGTEVVLTAGTRASLRAVGGHGARVSLTDGVARVDVAHLPGAKWLFDAGPFLINVTGTAFTLGWNQADALLDVQMDRGTVEVSGPLSDGAIVLRSGQHLVVRVRERETVIRDREDAPSQARAAAKEAASSGQEPAAVVAAQAPVPPRVGAAQQVRASASARAGAAPARNWAAQLAAGDSEEVVLEAQRRGLDGCLAEATSGELAALADAARYGRHDDVARRALLAQRRRFPLSGSAHDASFLLGRLEETENYVTTAIDWYERYLAESPTGTYASEALGRKMNLLQRVSGNAAPDARARAVADEYLARFPQGTYAARARALARAP